MAGRLSFRLRLMLPAGIVRPSQAQGRLLLLESFRFSAAPLQSRFSPFILAHLPHWAPRCLLSAPVAAPAGSTSPHSGLSHLCSPFKALCSAAWRPRPRLARAPSSVSVPARSLRFDVFLLPCLPASPRSEPLDIEGHVLLRCEPPDPGAAGNSLSDAATPVLMDGLTEAVNQGRAQR